MKTLRKFLCLSSGWDENDFTKISKPIILYLAFLLVEILIRMFLIWKTNVLFDFRVANLFYSPVILFFVYDLSLTVITFLTARTRNQSVRFQSCVAIAVYGRIPFALISTITVLAKNSSINILGIIYSFSISLVGFMCLSKGNTGSKTSSIAIFCMLYLVVTLVFLFASSIAEPMLIIH